MKKEEIIKRNYEYAQESMEEDIEYLVSGDRISSVDPKEEAKDTIDFFKKLEQANKEGVLLEDN